MQIDQADTMWRVPRRLDEPLRILMLTPAEFSFVGVTLLVGVLSDNLLIAIIAVGGVLYLMRMAEARFGTAWLIQLGFWYLPIRFKGIPYGWQRLWRG